jgi:NTE family protein
VRNLVVLFLLFSVVLGFSQDNPSELDNKKPKKDLKVGLVLSGGGAKGFAHIGVLKVLDELGVRIDYVGGTSAGAMIGGLYASGYNAIQIDSIIRSYDFNELIQDVIPREQFTLYQKENSEKYALTLPLKNWKIGLPVALSKGQNILNELTKLTKHVHNINDFSKLPIPFYCVATDIENGEKVVIQNGFLPLAIKASSAFPSLLEPVEIDGRLLLDGGIVDNFPVDIMQEMDMDIIIGVDVQDKLSQREDLDSAPKIIMQIISFQMYQEAEKHKERTDIYLHPNITNYTVFSFDKVLGLIDEGERIARKEVEYFEAIALQQTKKPIHLNQNIDLQKNAVIHINDITVNGHKNYTKNYILSKLSLKDVDSVTYDQFNICIKGLSATDNFKSIDYKFTSLDNNKNNIEFNLKENDISNTVNLGAHYDELYKTGVLVNFTSKHALTNNDFFSLGVVLGDNIRYNLDYFIDNGNHWQFGFRSRFNSFKDTFIIDSNPNGSIFNANQLIKYSDFTNQIYLVSKFGEKIGLKIGSEIKFLRISTEDDSSQKVFFDRRNYFDVFGELVFDTYDAKYFTKKGWYFNANYKLFLASSSDDDLSAINPFSQIKAKAGFAKTFQDKFTVQLTSDFGLTIGDNVPAFNFSIGGHNENLINNFVPFYGYEFGSMHNSAFIKATATARYELFDKNYVSFIANTAGINDQIFSDGSVFNDLKSGYAVGYGIKSIVGPIELKYSWTPDNNRNQWYFNIGFWF